MYGSQPTISQNGHFATRSPLAAAARNTFPRQLQTNFESFPNNCCISRDYRLSDYFIINMWKCYLLFELPCIFGSTSGRDSLSQTGRERFSCLPTLMPLQNLKDVHDTFVPYVIDSPVTIILLHLINNTGTERSRGLYFYNSLRQNPVYASTKSEQQRRIIGYC
jgi:hypothetical protein